MSFTKILIMIGVIIFCLGVIGFTQRPYSRIPTIALHYQYPVEKLIKAADSYLYVHGNYTLNIKKDFDLVLLGEESKIVIPQLSAGQLYFKEHFTTAEVTLFPACQWFTLETVLEQIEQRMRLFQNIKPYATEIEESNLKQWNREYFKNTTSAVISEYTFGHYKVAFYINKLTTLDPLAFHEEDYFQLGIRVAKL